MYISYKPLVVLTLLASVLTPPAIASPDQSQTQTDSIYGYNFFYPIGQSFTPTQNSLDYVSLLINQSGVPGLGMATLQVDIFEGAGFGGALLGTSQAVSPDFTTSDLVLTTFKFASPVALTPSSVYTFRIDPLNGDGGGALASNNPYARGTGYLNGTPDSEIDLYFVEGAQSAPVPEASTTVSFGLLLFLGGLAVAVKRRKSAASS